MNRGFIQAHKFLTPFLQRTVDGVIIIVSYYLAGRLYGHPFDNMELYAVIVALLGFYLVASDHGIYGSWRTASVVGEAQEIMVVLTGSLAILLGVAFLTKASDLLSRVVVFVWYVLAALQMIGMRFVVRAFLQEMRSRGRNTRSFAIVGANSVALNLVDEIKSMPWMGLVFKGFYDDSSERQLPSETVSKLAGNLSDLVKLASSGKIDVVYIALSLQDERRVIDLLNAFANTTVSVYFLPNFLIFNLKHARWVNINGRPVISIYETPFCGIDAYKKRLEDIVIGSAILAVMALPMIIIAIAVKLTSPGPVFFRQRRYGLRGEQIYVWKFRSMTVCEDGAGPITQAVKCDKRVTPIGAFLRRTSLDELPQFFNVLQGTMSIVGPRPHAVNHNEEYRTKIHGYMLRHKVKPGITGLAQANGWRGETDNLEKMRMRVEHDLRYIREWSLWLDLKIIWKTAWLVLRDRNAY